MNWILSCIWDCLGPGLPKHGVDGYSWDRTADEIYEIKRYCLDFRCQMMFGTEKKGSDIRPLLKWALDIRITKCCNPLYLRINNAWYNPGWPENIFQIFHSSYFSHEMDAWYSFNLLLVVSYEEKNALTKLAEGGWTASTDSNLRELNWWINFMRWKSTINGKTQTFMLI